MVVIVLSQNLLIISIYPFTRDKSRAIPLCNAGLVYISNTNFKEWLILEL